MFRLSVTTLEYLDVHVINTVVNKVTKTSI